jgi:hypothetical protein
MTRFRLASLAFLIALLPAVHARAQACDPFSVTLTQELFPHSSKLIPFFVLAKSTGCPTHTTPEVCLAKAVLPADAGVINPVTALANKCNLIVAAIQSTCSQFTVDNIDCDPTPNQMTQFTVTHTACSNQVVPPGKGLAVMSANDNTALSSFNPAGTLLPDYELDKVIPNCTGSELRKNMLVLSGTGGSGTTIFPGGASNFEVRVTTHQSGTISHAEPTLDPMSKAVTPEAMAAAQADALNETFVAIADDTLCTANGRMLQCDDTNAGLAGLGPEEHETPIVAAVSNDPAMPVAEVAGSPEVIEELQDLVQNGGCDNLETDCVDLVPEPGSIAMLACGGALLTLLRRRRMRARAS